MYLGIIYCLKRFQFFNVFVANLGDVNVHDTADIVGDRFRLYVPIVSEPGRCGFHTDTELIHAFPEGVFICQVKSDGKALTGHTSSVICNRNLRRLDKIVFGINSPFEANIDPQHKMGV